MLASSARLQRAAQPRASRPAARKLAVRVMAFQTEQPAGSGTALGVDRAIKKDHDGINATYKQYKSANDNEQKQKLAWQMIRDLAIHSLAEEEVVYPEFKNRLGSGARDHALEEHTELKKILVKLDGMKVTDDGFDAMMEDMVKDLNHHVEEEEGKWVPELASKMSAEELAQMGTRFQDAKRHVPTRPHVLPPNKPATGNVVANVLTGPLDKTRDAARWGGQEPPSAVLY